MNTAVAQGEDEIRRVPTEARCGGEWVPFGLDAYRLAPINLAVIKSDEFQADVATVASMSQSQLPTKTHLEAIVRIVHAALVRNYPSMTLAEVEAIVDMGNAGTVLGAAMGTSGFGKAGTKVGELLASTGIAPTAP